MRYSGWDILGHFPVASDQHSHIRLYPNDFDRPQTQVSLPSIDLQRFQNAANSSDTMNTATTRQVQKTRKTQHCWHGTILSDWKCFQKYLKHVKILGSILPDPETGQRRWVSYTRQFYRKLTFVASFSAHKMKSLIFILRRSKLWSPKLLFFSSLSCVQHVAF